MVYFFCIPIRIPLVSAELGKIALKDKKILSRVEGLRHEPIAKKLGISVVSSKTCIVRSLQHIRGYLSTHPGEAMLLAAWILVMKK
jgi:hypothetical protein